MELGNAASTNADITAQDVTLLANQTLMVTIINGINGINGSNGVFTASVVDETTP